MEDFKLFSETQRGHTYQIRKRLSVDNLNTFAYVNSKFINIAKLYKTTAILGYHGTKICLRKADPCESIITLQDRSKRNRVPYNENVQICSHHRRWSHIHNECIFRWNVEIGGPNTTTTNSWSHMCFSLSDIEIQNPDKGRYSWWLQWISAHHIPNTLLVSDHVKALPVPIIELLTKPK